MGGIRGRNIDCQCWSRWESWEGVWWPIEPLSKLVLHTEYWILNTEILNDEWWITCGVLAEAGSVDHDLKVAPELAQVVVDAGPLQHVPTDDSTESGVRTEWGWTRVEGIQKVQKGFGGRQQRVRERIFRHGMTIGCVFDNQKEEGRMYKPILVMCIR